MITIKKTALQRFTVGGSQVVTQAVGYLLEISYEQLTVIP